LRPLGRRGRFQRRLDTHLDLGTNRRLSPPGAFTRPQLALDIFLYAWDIGRSGDRPWLNSVVVGSVLSRAAKTAITASRPGWVFL
jgi:hypothetical protein